MRYGVAVVATVVTVCLAMPAAAAIMVDRCKAARLTGVQELIAAFCKGSAGEEATPQGPGGDASPQESGNEGAMDASPPPTAPEESQSQTLAHSNGRCEMQRRRAVGNASPTASRHGLGGAPYAVSGKPAQVSRRMPGAIRGQFAAPAMGE